MLGDIASLFLFFRRESGDEHVFGEYFYIVFLGNEFTKGISGVHFIQQIPGRLIACGL